MLAREILWARSSSICSHTTGQKYLQTRIVSARSNPDCPSPGFVQLCSGPLEVILMSNVTKIKATQKPT